MSKLSRRFFLGGLSSALALAGVAQGDAAWQFRVANIGLPPVSAVPVLTPTLFAAQASGEHDVQQPAPDVAFHNASGDAHCLERPTLCVDVLQDQHIKNGVPFVVSISADTPDTAKMGLSFRVTVAGDTGYVSQTIPENIVVSGRTGSIGTMVSIAPPPQAFPGNFGKGYLWLIVEAIPQNGYAQRIVKRLLVEGSDYLTTPGNIVYVSSNSAANPSDSYTTSSPSTPFATFQKAQASVNDGGLILVDPSAPLLWDVERTGGSGRSINDAVEVRSYDGSPWTMTRSGRGPITGYSTEVSGGGWKHSASPQINRMHIFGAIWDAYRINALTLPGSLSTGVNFAWVGVTFVHEQMTRDGHLHADDSYNFDGLISETTLSGTTLPYDCALIGCSGVLPCTGSVTLGINNNLHIAWDAVYAPNVFEFSYGAVRHNVDQDRGFFGAAHRVNTAKLPTTSIAQDKFNEIALVGLGWEVFPGTVSIVSVSGTTATLNFYDATGKRTTFAVNPNTPLVFDSGPLSGTTYKAWTFSNGMGAIALTGVPAGITVDPTARYPVRFKSYSAITGITSASTYEGTQCLVTDGNGKSGYLSYDSGGYSGANGVNNPALPNIDIAGQPRKLTPDYSVPNYILRSSLAFTALLSSLAGASPTLSPLNYTPYATVSGTTLTACSQNGPTAGGGNLTVSQDANGYYAMIANNGAFTAAQIFEGVTIRTGDGRTVRAAALVNATSAAAGPLPPYSFYLRDWNSSWPLSSGVSWSFSTVEGHGLVPGNQVQFGTGTVCNVLSVQGRSVTLDQAPGDLTTPTTFKRLGGLIDAAMVLIPSYDIYGQPIPTLLDPVSVGDGMFFGQPGNHQHPDAFQIQGTTILGGRSENIHHQNSRFRGTQLQTYQVGRGGADWRAGVISIDASQNGRAKIILPTLAVGSVPTASTAKLFGVAYPIFSFAAIDYSIAAGANRTAKVLGAGNINRWPDATNSAGLVYLNNDGTWSDISGNPIATPATPSSYVSTCDTAAGYGLFNFVNPKRQLRVLMKSGPYAEQSLRLYSLIVNGATATMVLMDDQGVTNGSWAGAATDLMQQPLMLFDGDVIHVGNVSSSATGATVKQDRMWMNDWTAIGSGWFDAPTTGAFATFTGSLTNYLNNWTSAYQMRDVGWVAFQGQFGMPGYNSMTIANPPLGGFGTSAGRNFYWKQSTAWLGQTTVMRGPWQQDHSGMYAFTILDSLHAGITGKGAGGGSIRASQVSIVNSLIGYSATAGLATDFVPDPSVVNATMTCDSATGVPNFAGGSGSTVNPTNLFDHLGQPRLATGRAGCI